MYLHPLIHTELIRQRELELSSRRPQLPSSQTAFKLTTLLIGLLAVLVLSTAASAATAKKPAHKGKPAKTTIRATHRKGHGGTVRVVSPRILYFPAPTQPQISSNTDANDDCVSYQVNCTNEQNCQYWGVNCDLYLITSTGNDAQGARQDGSASDSANEGAALIASHSLEPLPEIASDNWTSQAATDPAVVVAEPSQDEDC
jgi:hypothetical protein